MLDALQARGARLLDSDERERLRAVMWPDGRLSPAVTAKSADAIDRCLR